MFGGRTLPKISQIRPKIARKLLFQRRPFNDENKKLNYKKKILAPPLLGSELVMLFAGKKIGATITKKL